MNDPIPEPLRGADVISWAHPVTRALNALHDKIGAPTRNERDRRATVAPHPYEVRWDSSLNSGEGGYKIYLPTEHLLSYAGEDIATSDISGATVIQANNADTPWYSLDDIDTSADHVWLVVTVAESSGSIVSVDAEFAAEEGQAATGENVVNICIAEVSYEEPENEGDPAVVTIKQSVVGALHLGGAGGGTSVTPDDISTEFIPDPPSGTSPDGDEGQLQIKGFKTGTPADTNTVTDYLQGVVNIPNGGISLVCRGIIDGTRTLFYLPLAALFSSSSISGNVSLSYIGDMRWDTSTHTLQKKVNSVNLKTGEVTQGNWQTITNGNTTPISSIIN